MLKRIAALCLAASAFIAGSAKADLIGTSVTGSLQFGGVGPNYLDPANGFVPVGPENKTLGTTVPINTPQVEFGFQDGINHDTADFTGTTLTFTDVATGGGSAAQHYVFTDAAFAGLTLTELSDNFGGSGSAGGSLSWRELPA